MPTTKNEAPEKRRDPVQVLRGENDPELLIRAIDNARLPRKVRIFLAAYLRREMARRRDSPRGGRRSALAEEITRHVHDLQRRGVTPRIAKQMAAVRFDCSTRTIDRAMRRAKR